MDDAKPLFDLSGRTALITGSSQGIGLALARGLARAGAAVVLSSHLLHLLEEVCTNVLILKKGDKVANGTLAEVAAQFSNGEANVSLEEIFIRATGGSET